LLDPKFIRENLNRVREAVASKGESVDLKQFEALDSRRLEIIGTVERLKHDRNERSREIGRLKQSKGDTSALAAEARKLGDRIKELDEELRETERRLAEVLAWIPNVPHPDVPVGSARENRCVRAWGDPLPPERAPVPHYELAERLGIISFKQASVLSGAGFAVFVGVGARLARALVRFMLELHTTKHGFVEVATPYIVRRECLFGTGQLPKLEDDMYRCEVDDLFLIPTAEVSITNLYRGEILKESDLPIRLTGYSPCFRREAGAYGKDTRGLQRVHQFDKVELVKFTHPDASYDELETLLQSAEAVLQALGLAYRVVLLATGDLSFAAAKCYDLEVWAPSEGRWLEVSSCSNFESFQARRIGIRFRRADGKGTDFVHTLNGSGVALPRLLIALLETYQTAGGAVRVPDVLVPHMGGLQEIH
jgi:seryl-tRNA synthetase